jgi:hypothetical protein
MVFPKSVSQYASEDYNKLKIKILDFSHLAAFICFLTFVKNINPALSANSKVGHIVRPAFKNCKSCDKAECF